MAKGARVVGGSNLIPTSTRIEPETKKMLDALVVVQKLDGCRELINKMLAAYVEAHPKDVAKAKKLIAVLEEE
jgi:hypothetical protein